MPVFSTQFIVRAPLQAVADFHSDTRALKRLSPPPLIVHFHRLDPLAENSVAEFTLSFGPFPVRWIALHSQVDPLHGFTDTQTRGPLRSWVHTHRFEAVDEATTRVREHIQFQYTPGLRGLLTRFIYAPVMLRFLFAYRAAVTRRALEKPF